MDAHVVFLVGVVVVGVVFLRGTWDPQTAGKVYATLFRTRLAPHAEG